LIGGNFTSPESQLKWGNWLSAWTDLANKVDTVKEKKQFVKIAIVGKYTKGTDAYFSITKALGHASTFTGINHKFTFVDSEELIGHPKARDVLRHFDGILIPGGFGVRGIEGMVNAVTVSRDFNIPFFGICLGMQVAVIECARNDLDLERATSEEFYVKDGTNPPLVISFMPEISPDTFGGNMRLGSKITEITNKESLAYKIYGDVLVSERHRHRYEVEPSYVKEIEDLGTFSFSGKDKDTGTRMEVFELNSKKHPFFFGCQFHPEYQTTPLHPSKPFVAFMKACFF